MHIAEIILAFRLAKKHRYISNIIDYATCYGNCTSCPANEACQYLTGDKDHDTFKRNFDTLIRPHLQKYTMQYIKSYHPELFI